MRLAVEPEVKAVGWAELDAEHVAAGLCARCLNLRSRLERGPCQNQWMMVVLLTPSWHHRRDATRRITVRCHAVRDVSIEPEHDALGSRHRRRKRRGSRHLV